MEDFDPSDNLRNVVNRVAAELLQSGPDTFGNDLTRCMGMMAEAVCVDRVYIWKNHTIDGKLYCTKLYEWSGGARPQQNSELTTDVSYDDLAPEWEEMLSKEDCISGFVRDMSPAIRARLAARNILSIFMMPLFVHGQFWGFVGFDDCHNERIFRESEKSILKSVSILLVNALLRNAQDVEIREAHDRVKVVLDKTPFACHIWNKKFEMIDCNEENIRFFNVADKKELMERWADFSPEYQPDGQLSVDVARKLNQKAFDEGKCVLKEFIHMSSDGTPLPTEVTIVRIPYDDDFVIAVYLRDLREQKRMVDEIKHRDNLLSAGNHSATALLSAASDEKSENSILESMGYIGSYLNIDRIYFWRNVTIDGDLCYKLMCEWLNNTGYQGTPVDSNAVFSYTKYNPEWLEKFSRNECVNGPLSELSDSDKRVLSMYGMKSILVIPFFLQDVFWGFVSFEDCRNERRFSNDEVEILRSVGLMMANAFERSAQAENIREAHERAMLLLDATPLACRLMKKGGDGKFELFDCNEESVKLFGFRDKQEFIDRYFEIYPEYQPNGKNSIEEGQKNFDKAYAGGSCVANFYFQKSDGTLIPTEITLIRVKYGGEDVVAGYTRDLREQERMLRDIERKTILLDTVNQAANILLGSESDNFQDDFHLCMSMIGRAVGADRVCIWKNKTIEKKLYCDLIYDWPGGTGSLKNSDVAVNVSYDKNTPGWEEILSQGKCINTSVSKLTQEEQSQLKAHGVKSLFVAPVFIRNEFWGYVGFDDFHNEKIFSVDEASILYSSSLLIANALIRNEMILNIQSANDAKSSFLANMSHEMRTPLNAIIGLTDLALGNENLDRECLTTFEKVNNAGVTLLSTVNDILDISKIESGKFVLVPAVYEIPSLLNDTVTQSIMHKGEKPIQFILDIDGNLPMQLCGDELRIKQIFNNLLSNAFKYTREGTVELSIKCIREDETVWMTASVRDSGIGIRPEFIDSIFDNYAQMDVQANRKIMGTGLGLSITKMMVALMNGTINVESEYGKGSVFTVRLPQKYINDKVIGPEMADSLKCFRYYEQKRRQNSKLVRIRVPYARVLLVDDVVTNLDVAKGLMKPYGMQVDCVTSGQEAIDAIRRETIRYNAVFMDHMMPDMDGVEATRIIRETIGSEYAKTVPIIALTANAIAGNEEMFLSKGFQAFISKPIELNQLDAVIRQWVRDKAKEKLAADSGDGESQDLKDEQEKRIISSRRSGLDRRKVNKNLTGVDLVRGIERFNGDREIYFQVLHSFMVYTRPLLDSIKDVTEEQLAGYAIAVHGIKGSSRGIFADMIGNAAENLEKAAKAGDFTYVSAHNKTFLEAAWKLVFDIEDMLLNANSDVSKPVKDKPDEELLHKLLCACKSYSMDDVDDVSMELEKYQYDADDGLVSWLIDNIELMNFKQIIDRLS